MGVSGGRGGEKGGEREAREARGGRGRGAGGVRSEGGGRGRRREGKGEGKGVQSSISLHPQICLLVASIKTPPLRLCREAFEGGVLINGIGLMGIFWEL